MRYVAGTLIFVVMLSGSVAWGEAFPGARGQTEAGLLRTSVGRIATPVGAQLVSTVYQEAAWSPPPFEINLFGSLVQLVCARVVREYRAPDKRIVIDAVYAAATGAGAPRTAPDLDGYGLAFDQDTTRVLIAWSQPTERARLGYDTVHVTIIDLPESLGGRCQGTRLLRYRTLVNY